MTKFTVGGVPWEELTEEQRLKARQRATKVVSEIVTQHVQNMIDEGKSLDEIKKFLRIDKKDNYKN